MENEQQLYYHDHGDGYVHAHELEPEHAHSHSVKHMVEDGRDCTEVLVQLAAVRSALNSTAKIILKDHIEHCIAGVESGDHALEELNEAIDKFI